MLVDLYYTTPGEEKGEEEERKRKKRKEKERGKREEDMKMLTSIAMKKRWRGREG
jgi:hypothetical protein